MTRLIIYIAIFFASIFCFIQANGQSKVPLGSYMDNVVNEIKGGLQVNKDVYVPQLADSTGDSVAAFGPDGKMVNRKVSVPGGKMLGTLYNANTWSDLSDFDTSFSGVSISGGKINLTGGTRDSATVLSWDYTTCLTSWRMVSRFVVGEKSATSYGLAHGIKGKDEYVDGLNTGWSTFATLNLTTHATQGGKVYVLSGGNSSITAIDSSTAKLTSSVGDTIVLSTKWEYTRFSVDVKNITTGGGVQHTFDFGTRVRYNTGKFSLWSRGGIVTLDSLNISSEAVKDIDVIFIGDSKSSCVNATSISKCPTRIAQVHYPNSNIHAGVGDRVNDVMDALPEIRSLNPKQALINLYYNDLWNAPAINLMTEYAAMVDSLEAIGITTIKMTPQDYPSASFPDIRQRYDSFRTWLFSTYDSASIIDVFFDMQKCGVPCNFFNAHPNDTGYAIIANKIINSKKLTGATEMHELIQRIIGDTAQVLRASMNVATPTLQQILASGNIATLSATVAGLTSNGAATVNSASTAGTQTAATFLHPGTSTGDNTEVIFGARNSAANGGSIVGGNNGGTDNYMALKVGGTEIARLRNSSSYRGFTTGIPSSQSVVAGSEFAIGSHMYISAVSDVDIVDTFLVLARKANGVSRFSLGTYRLSSTLANNNITFPIHNGVGASTTTNAFVIAANGIETEQPTASGAGRVRFGKVLTGSDTNKYWEVEIDGVDYYIRALTSLP